MTTIPKIAAPALCPTYVNEAAKIWNDLKLSLSQGIDHKEETITENLLLNIQKAHPYEVLTFQFRNPEEKVTGADWEWWLTNGHSWLGLLIQAKRLDPASHKYKGIKHKVGKAKVPQIDLLIQQAAHKAIDPLYFFYNYSPNGLKAFGWKCSCMSPTLPQLGCTVAHARAVTRQLQKGGAGLPKLSKLSFPMRCIVCCLALADPDHSLPGRANGIVKTLRGFGARATRTAGLDPPGPRAQPPPYVHRLLGAPLDERGRVIEELRKEVGPIGSLVVIKERRERRPGGDE